MNIHTSFTLEPFEAEGATLDREVPVLAPRLKHVVPVILNVVVHVKAQVELVSDFCGHDLEKCFEHMLMFGQQRQQVEQMLRPHKRHNKQQKFHNCIPHKLSVQKLERDVVVQRPVRISEAHAEKSISHGTVFAIPKKETEIDQTDQAPQPLPVL